MARLYD